MNPSIHPFIQPDLLCVTCLLLRTVTFDAELRFQVRFNKITKKIAVCHVKSFFFVFVLAAHSDNLTFFHMHFFSRTRNIRTVDSV